jgi:Zn-dependent M28 family amino/carboxypeptidase
LALALSLALLVGLPILAALLVVTQPVLVLGRRVPQARAEAGRLQALVSAIVGVFPRTYRHPESLDRVAALARRAFEEAGAAVSEQVFTAEGRTYRNVVARMGPAEGDIVVAGAHYDACGELPAADDNASGVAVLLEVARLLRGAPLARRLELVAYTLEEPPFFGGPQMGSAVHASSLARSGARVVAALSLEMLGCYRDEPGSQQYPVPGMGLVYPRRGNFVAVVGRLGESRLTRRVKRAMRASSELPVVSMNAPRGVPGADLSDHASYWAQGFPALLVTDTAFYRNERYHTERDLPETLDYRRMALAADGVAAALRELAGTR